MGRAWMLREGGAIVVAALLVTAACGVSIAVGRAAQASFSDGPVTSARGPSRGRQGAGPAAAQGKRGDEIPSEGAGSPDIEED
jgi:hypothetical protein